MRPLALRLSAFGPFPEHESIRFGPLNELGLFVVTGPTGSGKTTVFDAMAFALYGDVAGDRPSDVRSHHAAAQLGTEVEFEFDIDGNRYRVLRRPAQERPKKTGQGLTKEAASAELFHLTDDGWQGIASKPTAVTARCTQLVGLDLEQFQRVVLLPQGKFAEFLLADTNKRQELLRQLFGTSLFQRVTEWLRDEAKRLDLEVAATDAEIDRYRRNACGDLIDIHTHLGLQCPLSPEASVDAIDEVVLPVGLLVAERRRQLSALAQRATESHAAATAGKQVAERYERSVQLGAQQADLVAEEADVLAGAQRAAQARRALPVVAASHRADVAGREVVVLEADEQRHRAGVVAAFVALGLAPPRDPTAAATALAERRAQLDADALQLQLAADALAERDAKLAEVQQATVAAAETAERTEAVRRQLADAEGQRVVVQALARQSGELEVRCGSALAMVQRRDRLDEVARLLVAANVDVDAALQREVTVVQAYALGVAPRLAAELRPGQPCMVCGSTEHPSPAVHHPELETVDARQIDQARELTNEARRVVAALMGEATGLATELGDQLQRSAAELADDYSEAQRAAHEAQQAQRRLDALDSDVAALCAARDLAESDQRAADAGFAAADAVLQRAQQALATADAAVADLDRPAVAAGRTLALGAAETLTEWSSVVALVGPARGELGGAQAALAAALASADFDNAESAAEVALEVAHLERLEARALDWQRALAGVRAALAELRQQGIPDAAPDTAALDALAADVSRQAAGEADAVAQLEKSLADAIGAIRDARAEASGSADLRSQRDVARQVMLTCTGSQAPRVMLETWVLAGELDRVTRSATVHLQRMSKGRYALRRGEAATGHAGRRSGLDLSVFDAHTGRERSPATLSGGECFQASLALALGLADVVSQGGTGSGRVFEALFVDEGFGSLDPDALDDAIDALQHLQASGRMVGVITHVEAMKQQLPTGIEIRRRPDGRGSTIIQP